MSDPVTAASGADQPTLREQLAEALANARPWLESWDELPEVLRDQFRISVDALLPLIEADRERAKAEALDDAAAWVWDQPRPYAEVWHELRDRAEALRAGGET